MITDNIVEFYRNIQGKNPVLIGIDYGTKKIGLSITSTNFKISFPDSILYYSHFDEIKSKIDNIKSTKNVTGIVIGYPLDMNNKITEQTLKTRKFAEYINKATKIPVYLQDERLTSKGAYSQLSQLKLSKKEKIKQIDLIASNIILDTAIMKINNLVK